MMMFQDTAGVPAVTSAAAAGVCVPAGINAYFSYTVVGFYGAGMISYQEALAAVFVEGWIFIIISLTGQQYILPSILSQR